MKTNSKPKNQKFLKLHNWYKEVDSKKSQKRVGRGIGSGTGKTSTRGHKGQRSRSGHKISSTFEGGQMSFQRRIPKSRGFRSPNKVVFQVVNLSRISSRKMSIVNKETLLAEKLIRNLNSPIKILGVGELNMSVSFEVNSVSKIAGIKIKKAKGQIKLI